MENSHAKKRRIKKDWVNVYADGHRTQGGSRHWPPWVVQMICELLINGTAPMAVPSTIQSIYEMLYNKSPEELPSVNFVRECRVVVEIIGETLVAIKLGRADFWDQLWTDSTTRWQIPFTALIIGILAETRQNKDVVGAWRLDLPIDVENTSDNESDGKTGEGGSEIEISDGDGDGDSECSSTTSTSSSS